MKSFLEILEEYEHDVIEDEFLVEIFGFGKKENLNDEEKFKMLKKGNVVGYKIIGKNDIHYGEIKEINYKDKTMKVIDFDLSSDKKRLIIGNLNPIRVSFEELLKPISYPHLDRTAFISSQMGKNLVIRLQKQFA